MSRVKKKKSLYGTTVACFMFFDIILCIVIFSDPWIKAAIRCIEDEMEVITIISHCHARAQELDSPDLAYKLYLFKYICEIYSAERGPLIPPQLLDVVSAILGALANGKTSRAIELCQICLLLVGNQARDKIQRLLEFMVIASDSRQIRLEVKVRMETTQVCFISSFFDGRVTVWCCRLLQQTSKTTTGLN